MFLVLVLYKYLLGRSNAKVFEYSDFNDSLLKNIKIVVTDYSWINTFYLYICSIL
jgi:hypothetical protein